MHSISKTTTNFLEKNCVEKQNGKSLSIYPELSSYTLCIAYATLTASDDGVRVLRDFASFELIVFVRIRHSFTVKNKSRLEQLGRKPGQGVLEFIILLHY